MQSEFLSPTYFPFTFISPTLVEVVALFFQRVVVYQPAYAKPDDAVKSWIDSGLLDVRSPSETNLEERDLEAALRDLKSWGALHEKADLALLKLLRDAIQPVSPETPVIASAIRSTKSQSVKEATEPHLSIQLFLHLAHEFDRDAWELRRQLKMVEDEYQALQSSFRQDQEETTLIPPTAKEPVSGGGDDFRNLMIERRLAAWNHLFQNDSLGSSVLFTDSQPAFDHLLDGIEEKVDVLDLDIPLSRAGSGEGAGLDLVCDLFSEIVHGVPKKPWDPALKQKVMDRGREIASQIEAGKEPSATTPQGAVSWRWVVVPGLAGHTLLNQQCVQTVESGVNQADGDQNTLIGLIQRKF